MILAAEVTQAHNDGDQLGPMMARTAESLREAGVDRSVAVVLADGGYWNSSAISEVRGQGIDVLIPTQDRTRTKPRRLARARGATHRATELTPGSKRANFDFDQD